MLFIGQRESRYPLVSAWRYNRMEWQLFLDVFFYDIFYSMFFVNDINWLLKRFSKTQPVYEEGMFTLQFVERALIIFINV